MIDGALNYARARMNNLGYQEWTDSFNFENIPRTLLEDVYHLELGTVSRKNEQHDNIELNVPLIVRLFSRSFLNTGEGRDAAIILADTVIDSFVKGSNRLGNANIETIQFDQLVLQALNEENDNSLMLIIDFTALTIKSTR